MKLTAAAIPQLTVPEGRVEAFFWDEALPGFGLRVRAGGKRSWVVQYRMGGKQRRVTIGTPATHTLDKARRSAGDVMAKVRLGEDWQANRHKAVAVAALTLDAVVRRYVVEHVQAKQRPRSQAETRRHLEKHWKPLHPLPLSSIDRRLVADRVGRLAQESGPIAANRARSALVALFSWAMREGLTDANPVIGTTRPGLEVSRERVLSAVELHEVWHACGDDDYGHIVRLLILTGQRREEVAALAESELRLDRAMWSLSGARTKNGLPHDVPLSPAALEVIATVHRRAGRELLFGQAAGGFKGWGRAKARLDERLLAARRKQDPHAKAPPRWTLHDLRRTVVTGMNEIGVAPHVVEAVVNHVSGTKAGVAGTYNRAAYAAEKRRALDRWAQHVHEIVAGSDRKIVPMRA